MTYQLLLTNLGAAKIAAASNVSGKPLKIAEFVVGQGIDVDFSKRLDKQVLVSKRYQAPVHSVAKTAIPNRYEITCVIPPEIGGWAIREMGLIDSDGDLIWVGALPEVVKPTADDVSAVDYRLRAIVQVDNPDVVMTIDANLIFATEPWVEANFIPRSALELMYPIGHPYWSASPIDPTPLFDTLFGYKTYWRRVQDVELVAIKDGDANIGIPRHQTGKHYIGTANTTKPDGYPLYPLYLWVRYQPVKYDGLTRADGTAQYM